MPRDLQYLEHYLEGIEPLDIYIFEDVKSTNTTASEIARNALVHPTLVVANTQSAGRGRAGRSWYSPADKNIYMSILIRPENRPVYPELVTLYTAVCVIDALIYLVKDAQDYLWIKWPNDIYWEDKKLGGILTECVYCGKSPEYFVIGIGLNVNSQKKEISEMTGAVGTSLLAETKRRINRDVLIAEITRRILNDFKFLSEPDKIRVKWKKRTRTIGAKVKIIHKDRTFIAIAEDIDSNGRLIVRNIHNGERLTLGTADIIHLR